MKSTKRQIRGYTGFRYKITDRLNKLLMDIVANNTAYKSFLPNIFYMIRYNY